MMDVSLICNHNVATVGKSAGIADAAALMRAEHVGDLVVVEPRGNARYRSESDGSRHRRRRHRDARCARYSDRWRLDDAKSADGSEDASVEFALREMRRSGMRAPVVRANGDLVGVIAVDDIIQHLAVQLTGLADLIRLEQDTEQRTRP